MPVFYPEIEPAHTHYLTRDGHCLHIEESGNLSGFPALFLHGGPGAGCKPDHRRFFDPAIYRIILVDQRGAGLSTPKGGTEHNTTADLLDDLEAIREFLEINSWLVMGGSWGATLALLYAQAHPQRVAGMILRGTFLARQADLEWFAGTGGVRRIYPEAWEALMHALPASGRDDPLVALYGLLTGADELAQFRAARAWESWGGQVVLGDLFDIGQLEAHAPLKVVHQARIELHYAIHRYFIGEDAVLAGCGRIRHIPVTIIHGRRDLVCPVESAWALHQQLPVSILQVLPDAGHIAAGESMVGAVVAATDAMAVTLGAVGHE